MSTIPFIKEILPYIKKALQTIYPKQTNQTMMLGRWRRHQNDNITYNRVDLANHDHCGTCQYHPLLNEVQKNQISEPKKDNH